VCVEGKIKVKESESEDDDVEVNDPYRYFTQMEDEDLVNLWPKGKKEESFQQFLKSSNLDCFFFSTRN
jgi:hypothetical protein